MQIHESEFIDRGYVCQQASGSLNLFQKCIRDDEGEILYYINVEEQSLSVFGIEGTAYKALIPLLTENGDGMNIHIFMDNDRNLGSLEELAADAYQHFKCLPLHSR